MADTVAVVGLGAMGLPVARCLLRKGFGVRGFDVRAAALDALQAAGGETCASPAEAGSDARIAMLVVLNADQVEQVMFGADGLVHSLAPGTVVASMATMSPERTRSLGARAVSEGLRWLDTPISGGTQRAAEGSLTTMVGGEANDLERARAMLQAFSRHVFHLGPVGSGATAKMVNQMLVYCHLAAAVEAMTLCRKAGADAQAVYDVICTAMGASAIFESRIPRLIDGTLESGGSMRIAMKDLAIVEDTARELGMPTLMTAQATQLYRAAAAMGFIDADDLAVARVVESLSGL